MIISKDLAILLKPMNSAAASMIPLANIWHFFLPQDEGTPLEKEANICNRTLNRATCGCMSSRGILAEISAADDECRE